MPRAYWSATAASRATTSSTTWANACTVTWTPTSGKSYAVLYSCAFDTSNNDQLVYTALREGGTVHTQRATRMPANADAGTSATHREVVAWLYTATDSASHTFALSYKVQTASAVTLGISGASLVVLELDTNDRAQVQGATQNATSTTYATRATVTLPSGARDYLCIVSAALTPVDGTVPTGKFRGLYDGSAFSAFEPALDPGTVLGGAKLGVFGALRKTAAGGEVVAAQYAAHGSGDEVQIDDATVICLALDGFSQVFSAEQRTLGTTTATTLQDRVTLAPSLADSDYLVIEAGVISATATSGNPRTIVRSLYEGAAAMSDAYRTAIATTYAETFGRVGIFRPVAGTRTFKIQWRTETNGTGRIADAGIYLLRVGTAATTYDITETVTVGLSDTSGGGLAMPVSESQPIGLAEAATLATAYVIAASESIALSVAGGPPAFETTLVDENGDPVLDELGLPLTTIAYGYAVDETATLTLTDDGQVRMTWTLSEAEAFIWAVGGSTGVEETTTIREQLPPSLQPWGAAAWGGMTMLPPVELETVVLEYATQDLVLNGAYVPGVLMPFSLEQALRGSGGGMDALPTISIADLSLANGDGELDTLTEQYLLEGRRVRLSVAELVDGQDPVETDFQTVAVGVIDRVRYRDTAVTLELRDAWARLQQRVQSEFYLGTGGIDGGPELEGLTRPLTFGVVRNIPATLVDPARLIYQVHRGDVLSIDRVYDAGVPLTIAVPTSTYEQLQALRPQRTVEEDGSDFDFPLGSVAYCLPEGCFRLSGLPVGAVTADVHGSGSYREPVRPWSGGRRWSNGRGWYGVLPGHRYYETAGQLIVRLLVDYGPFTEAEVDIGGFAQVDAETPRVCGLHFPTGGSTTVGQAVANLCASVGIALEFSSTGAYRPRRITAPVGGGAVIIDDDMIEVGGLKRVDLPYGRGTGRQRVRYDYNPRQMTDAEIAASVVGDERQRLTKDWSAVEVADDDLVWLYPDLPAASIDTALAERDDARTEANRRLAIYRPDRQAYELAVTQVAFRLNIGSTVTLRSSRFGLEAGRQVIVSRIRETSKRPITELTVWG